MLTFRLNGRLLEAAETMAAAGGLTAARWQVLGAVLDEPRSVADIARNMGLTRQSVQRIANVLADEGFAEWQPNPRHRRAKLLRPTQRARAAIKQVGALQGPWAADVGGAVGEDDIRTATRTVQRLLTAIQERPLAGDQSATQPH